MTTITPIVIHGAGGHGRETALLIEALVLAGAPLELVGFLDDDRSRHGTTCGDLPVLGGLEWLSARPGLSIALGVGSPTARQSVVRRIAVSALRYPTLVHPSVSVHRRVTLGHGIQLHAGTVLTTDIRIHDFVICNRHVDISHDCVLDDYATLAPAVTLTGGVHIGRGADLGARATCIPGVRVGEWSVVGAGAVVTRDVEPDTTAVGVPARALVPGRQVHGSGSASEAWR